MITITDAMIARLRAWEGTRFPLPIAFTTLHEEMCTLSSVTGVHADGGFFAYIVHGGVWPELDWAKWHFVDVTNGEILTFDTLGALVAELDSE